MREYKFRAWDKYQKVMYVSPCWQKYFLEEADHE